ncbi:NTPase, DNA primase [Eptesipox virus]|uniref:NTPase and DNA replication protein n=1 Tax=Eptesipox virus TaxID=1329402 RepID=R4JK99_9POXV|nr:NTPase, DNA primase [Eptesipox virus]AGK89948.1 NTPase and DNA replication protein [Eptesipox virus]ASK51288.1 NTPase, DNA primase [Eptesipox virus]WAH71046.1 NTPase, DNA primase [Eptesipox virus]
MASSIVDNNHIFVLKSIGVPSSLRESEDSRFVEVFTCDELEEYIQNNPTCTLFETLRDEEAYSIVRVFFDVDLDGTLDEIDMAAALKDFILQLTKFVSIFSAKECDANQSTVLKCLRSNFSLTKSTNSEHTSFHIIFPDTYTTMDTLIAMKRPLLEFSRASENPLIRAIDPAIYRRKATLRIVGTRKVANNDKIHIKQPPHNNISDYLFTYVHQHNKSCYFSLARRLEDTMPSALWEPTYITFDDAMEKVSKIIINDIVNFSNLDENNFTTTPLIIDYMMPCALCKKKSHKHHHQLSLSNGMLKIYKAGNPHSCKVKVITLEGNKLYNVSQLIMDANVIHLTDRGDYIVWIQNSWKFNNGEESLITKLILSMKEYLPSEHGPNLLCPRKRKIIENNLKDMLIEPIETDINPTMLQFKNGVLNIETGEFYTGQNAKEYICTVSTGYNFNSNIFGNEESDEYKELTKVINDIQPQTKENASNRELYERTLSSCLYGSTKQCLTFFYGETATGKSTTKRILHSAIGDLFIETGQTILTDAMDKGPNPFIANMHLKRSVFCSELPDFACNGAKKIRADNIKKLTEPCIVGRQCFSNKINNKNHGTIIIDTNYRPVFDRVDNALMRRVALVKFRTHFSQLSNHEAAKNNAAYNEVKLLDENLDMKIQRNYFRHAFLHMLVKWYQKYHVPNMRLYPTPEMVPDFVFHLKINSLIVVSSITHIRHITKLIKLGYIIVNELLVIPVQLFQQKLLAHFNMREYGHDIENFIARHKKFVNVTEEYLEYIFIEDITSK